MADHLLSLSPKRRGTILLALSVFVIVLLGLSLATYWNRIGLLIIRIPQAEALSGIEPEHGLAYIAPTKHPELSSHERPSSAQVLEDGKPLPGPANASHAEIRSMGRGRHSFWYDRVYFSTSDNSDPRSNGRRYAIGYPLIVHVTRPVALGLYALTFLACGLMVRFYLSNRDLPMVKTLEQKAMQSVAFLARSPFLITDHLFLRLSQKRRGKIFLALAASVIILLGLSLMTHLNRIGLSIIPAWQVKVLSDVEHEDGLAYVASTEHPELSSHERPSSAQVLEDGKPLPGPANALHADIRDTGQGRYSFWYDRVRFSTSDNSDPRTNGRRYEVSYPLIVHWSIALGLYALTLLVCGVLARYYLSSRDLPIVKTIERKATGSVAFLTQLPFLVPILLVLLTFLITRLPFLLHYPVVGIESDTHTYDDLVITARNGGWPNFSIRTPGFPLFLWLVTSCTDSWMAVIIAQSLLSLSACLCLVYGVYRLRRPLALPTAVAVCGFLGSDQTLICETSVLSESLYTSSIMLSFALLLLAFSHSKPIHFALASASMAFVILVRPSGMYFLVIYALVLAYLLWNRYAKRVVAHFAIPFPALLLALCAYNYCIISEFVLTAFGEVNLAGATALYWESDPRLPDFVNTALKDYPASLQHAGIDSNDLRVLATSWDPTVLFPLFAKSYNSMIGAEKWGYGSRFGSSGYIRTRAYVRQVSFMAIRKHPDLYAKFVWANMAFYFWSVQYKPDFYQAIRHRVIQHFLIMDRGYDLRYAKEYVPFSLPDKVQMSGGGDDASISLQPTFLARCHGIWRALQRICFLNVLWVWLFLAVLVSSAVQFVRSRCHHLGAFILLVFTGSVLGASMVVCLVEIAMDRYANPTQFVYYLSLALLPLLWTRQGDTTEHSGDSRTTVTTPLAQQKHAEWHDQWTLFRDNERFLFEDWIAPVTLDAFRGKTVLECGCGGGQHTAFVAPLASSVTAVDLNTSDIAHRRNVANKNVAFVEADIATMDLKRQFDMVMCIGVIHHTDNPDRTFANLCAHCKPGGTVIVWTYSAEGNELVRYIVEPIRKIFLQRMPRSTLVRLSRVVTALLYPVVYTLYRIPFLSFLPYYEYFGNFRRLSYARNVLNVFDKLNAPQTQFTSLATCRRWLSGDRFAPDSISIRRYAGVSYSLAGTKKTEEQPGWA